MADLRIGINGEDNASRAFVTVGDAAKGFSAQLSGANVAIAAFVKFGKEALKAAEDQARADRQLAAVAGDLTDSFKRQASALQSTLGVSDDMVEKMQTMLLRYGEAPAQVDKTIKSILDYAAVSGTDAVSATQTLISSVESGRTAFKELGLTYEKTGHKSKDLEAVTEALRLKVGGAAEKDASSVTGSAQRASESFGELQETFGMMIGTFVQKTHVLEALKSLLEDINKGIGGDEKFNRDAQWTAERKRLDDLFDTLASYRERGVQESADAWVQVAGDIDATTARLKALEEAGKQAAIALPNAALGGGDDRTMKQREHDKTAQESAKKHDEEMEKIRRKNEKDIHDYYKSLDEMDLHAQQAKEADQFAAYESAKRMAVLEQQEIDERRRKADEAAEKAWRKHDEAYAKWSHDNAQEMKQKQKEMDEMGKAIGLAFANSLADAIGQLSAGGEIDTTELIGDIVAGLIGAAVQAIGIAFPAAAPFLAVGGALAGAGIKAATRNQNKRKRHDGGWVGDEVPRHHGGAWIGTDEEAAILQTGERVLSRPEVQAMGGPRGVDSAARGGRGSTVINVQAFDGASTQTFFERAGGRALINAMRTGRGAPALLFGGG